MEWPPTNEQIREVVRQVAERGTPEAKKVLSAFMKTREFLGGGTEYVELPEGVRRELLEALKIVKKYQAE